MVLVTGDLSRISLHKRREGVTAAAFGVLDDAAGPVDIYLNTESLVGAKETRRSGISRASGVMGPSRMVGRTGGGQIVADLAFGAQLYAFMEEAMLSLWTAAYSVSSTVISADGPSNELRDLTSSSAFDSIEKGTWILVGGWTTPAEANNAEAYVSDKPDADTLVLSYVTLVTKIAGDTVTIDGMHLRNGTTPISCGYERHEQDLDEYTYYAGQVINNMSLPLSLSEIVTPTWDLLGFGPGTKSGSSAWANPVVAAEAYIPNVIDKQNNLTLFRAGGVLYGQMRSLSLNWTNTVSLNLPGEGLDPVSVSAGTRTLSGDLESYMLAADGRVVSALGHLSEEIHFRLANDAGTHILWVTIYAAKATTAGDVSKSAPDGPSLLTTPWEADAPDWDPDILVNYSRLGL